VRPDHLFYCGRFLPDVMRHARVTEEKIRAAVRNEGLSTHQPRAGIRIGNRGTFSVVWQRTDKAPSSMNDVAGYPAGSSD
jgi:hypothetical protein